MKMPKLFTALALTLPLLASAAPDSRILPFAGQYQPVGSCKIFGHSIATLTVTANHAYRQNNVSVNFMGPQGSNREFDGMPVHGATFSDGCWTVNNSYKECSSVKVSGNSLLLQRDGQTKDVLTLNGNQLATRVPGGSCRFVKVGYARNDEAGKAAVQEASLVSMESLDEKPLEDPVIEQTAL